MKAAGKDFGLKSISTEFALGRSRKWAGKQKAGQGSEQSGAPILQLGGREGLGLMAGGGQKALGHKSSVIQVGEEGGLTWLRGGRRLWRGCGGDEGWGRSRVRGPWR